MKKAAWQGLWATCKSCEWSWLTASKEAGPQPTTARRQILPTPKMSLEFGFFPDPHIRTQLGLCLDISFMVFREENLATLSWTSSATEL